VQTSEEEVLLRGTLTNSGLRAGDPGKGSCSMCFLLVISITLCRMIEIACYLLVCALFHRSFWFFFPETAWRFNPYLQAAHQWWALFLFWFESPGGDEFLPGSATSFSVFVVVCCYSCKCVCVFCGWCEWVLLDTFLDRNGLPN